MKFELILTVDSGDHQITNVPLAQMTRPDVSELATLGLSVPESKQLLAQLQHEIVTRQFQETTQQRRHGGQCGTKRAIKDFHGARFRMNQCDTCRRQPRVERQVVGGKARPSFVVHGDWESIAVLPPAVRPPVAHRTTVARPRDGRLKRQQIECLLAAALRAFIGERFRDPGT
jgi:hypothetical protein